MDPNIYALLAHSNNYRSDMSLLPYSYTLICVINDVNYMSTSVLPLISVISTLLWVAAAK